MCPTEFLGPRFHKRSSLSCNIYSSSLRSQIRNPSSGPSRTREPTLGHAQGSQDSEAPACPRPLPLPYPCCPGCPKVPPALQSFCSGGAQWHLVGSWSSSQASTSRLGPLDPRTLSQCCTPGPGGGEGGPDSRECSILDGEEAQGTGPGGGWKRERNWRKRAGPVA